MFKLGLQRTINSDDIYKNAKKHDARQLSEQFEEFWEIEKCTKRPSIYRVIWKLIGFQIFGLGILYTCVDILSRYAKSIN